MAGPSLGIGALYSPVPAAAAIRGEAAEMFNFWGKKSGERVTPFSFVQLSDAQVEFSGPPGALGTQAFEPAVERVNDLAQRPDLVRFTGDLTHDTEDKNVHTQRMKQFLEISRRMSVPLVKRVPGEHDAGLDGGSSTASFCYIAPTPSTIAACTLWRSTMCHRPSRKADSEQIAWLTKISQGLTSPRP
jgi:hypothetical protein